MAKTDNVRQVDLPRATGGGPVYIRGGGAGGVSNADTVDGYHASSTPTARKLLALDSSAQFNPSVIEWADVAGAGLSASGDTLVVRWGSSPTTIVPDASTAGGSASTSARSDHTHAIACAAPTTNLSVTSANAEGSATSFARSDHSHAINTSSNPGANASILASSAQGYLQLVRLGLGVAPSYPLQVQGTTPQLRLQQDASNYADFEVAGDGDLTIQPSGDSLLVPSGKTLASANWVSQTTGWGIYPESTYGRDGYADFRYIYADELHVKVFITDLEQALAGGQIISKSVAILAADFTIPAKGASATLVVEDLPGTTAYVFANNDWIRIRNISRSGGGLIVADAYGTVTQLSQNGDGTQTYTFTRAAADTGSAVAGTVVQKGGLVLDYGVSGNGYWEVTTLDPAGSPYAQVATWKTHPQNLTVHARLGNLDGIAGVGREWGLWAGKDSNHWIKVSDAGAEIKGLKQTWINAGGNTRGMVDPTATGSNYLFWLGPSSGDKRFGVTADGTVYIGNVPSSNIAGWAHASDLTKIDGGDIYAGSVTAAQMSVTMANVIDNPSFESGATGWILNPGASVDSAGGRSGPGRLVGDRNRADGYAYAEQRIYGIRAEEMYYVECWCWCSGAVRNTGVQISWRDASGAGISSSYCRGDTSHVWTRHSALVQAPPGTSYAIITCRQWGTPNAAAPRWDDLVMRPASGMNLVVGTPGAARMEINNAGIEGYSDANTKQFYIRMSDGVGAFGPSGKESLISEGGLRLWGGETVWTNFSAVRWLANPEVVTAGRVAAIGAGLYDEGTAPSLQLIVNPGADYFDGGLSLLARSSTPEKYAVMEMHASPTWGGTWTTSSVHGAALAWSMRADSDGFKFIVGNLQRAAMTAAGLQVTGRVGIGIAPSYPLHIAKSDLVGIQIVHEATTANRALVVTRRNAANNATLEWYQEFGTGDTPAWSFTRVNRPDGSGSGFLTALSIGWNGDVYVAGILSAEGLIDRTPYPDKATALAAVRSMRQAKRATGGLDHEALHEYVRARNKGGETGRNLSATVSAQNVVIQELLRRIELLEKDRRES